MIQHYTTGKSVPISLMKRDLFWNKKGKIKRTVVSQLLRRFKQEVSLRLKTDYPDETEFPQLVGTPVTEFTDGWAMGHPGNIGADVHVLFQTKNLQKWDMALEHAVVYAWCDVFMEVIWEIDGWEDQDKNNE